MSQGRSTLLRGGPFDGQRTAIEREQTGTVIAGPDKGEPVMLWPPVVDVPRGDEIHRYVKRAGGSYYAYAGEVPVEVDVGSNGGNRGCKADVDLDGSRNLGATPSTEAAEVDASRGGRKDGSPAGRFSSPPARRGAVDPGESG